MNVNIISGIISTFVQNEKTGELFFDKLTLNLRKPFGIDINQKDGCMYIADYGTKRIKKVTPQGNNPIKVALILFYT